MGSETSGELQVTRREPSQNITGIQGANRSNVSRSGTRGTSRDAVKMDKDLKCFLTNGRTPALQTTGVD